MKTNMARLMPGGSGRKIGLAAACAQKAVLRLIARVMSEHAPTVPFCLSFCVVSAAGALQLYAQNANRGDGVGQPRMRLTVARGRG